jgi:hypothetical protein
VGTPSGGGTIHLSAFGDSHDIDYVVISSAGSFLVDDIVYCNGPQTPPGPSSIYPGEVLPLPPADCPPATA